MVGEGAKRSVIYFERALLGIKTGMDEEDETLLDNKTEINILEMVKVRDVSWGAVILHDEEFGEGLNCEVNVVYYFDHRSFKEVEFIQQIERISRKNAE